MGNSNKRVNASALEAVLETVMPPALYRAVEQLCIDAIAASDNAPQVRTKIANLSFQMKMLAQAQFGHDTADTHAISQLLERTNPDKRQIRLASDLPTRQDPLALLENRRALDADQLSAAAIYREVWGAFGRFLQISGRSWDGAGGGARSRVLQPLDVMGQDVYEKWQNLYRPWTIASRARGVERKRGAGKIMPEKILFEILVEGVYPTEVDARLNLVAGSAMRCLKQELKLFMDPDAIARADAALKVVNERQGVPDMAAA